MLKSFQHIHRVIPTNQDSRSSDFHYWSRILCFGEHPMRFKQAQYWFRFKKIFQKPLCRSFVFTVYLPRCIANVCQTQPIENSHSKKKKASQYTEMGRRSKGAADSLLLVPGIRPLHALYRKGQGHISPSRHSRFFVLSTHTEQYCGILVSTNSPQPVEWKIYTSTNLSWSLPVKKRDTLPCQSVCSRFHSIRGIDFEQLIVVAWFVRQPKFGFYSPHLDSQYCGNIENYSV